MNPTISHLHTVLKTNATPSYNECCSMLLSWITEFDRSEHGRGDSLLNDMHVVGMGMCAAFCRYKDSSSESYNLVEALCHFADRIVLCENPICDMSWQEVVDVVTTLQIEFHTLFEPQENGGFSCCIKMQRLVIELMARLGFFLSRSWRCTREEANEVSLEVAHGVFEVDADGWQRVRDDSVVQVLDGIHAIAAASWLILSAKSVPDADMDGIELQNFHRESSLDDFYELSQISDTPMGAITQYIHKFRHLFHSTSQVVFYHFPSYSRRKQLSMNLLLAEDSEPIAILPLLMQIAPTIPVIHEHTGAGLRAVHACHKWQWIVVSNIVLLSDSDMHVYHAHPCKLLAFAQSLSSSIPA